MEEEPPITNWPPEKKCIQSTLHQIYHNKIENFISAKQDADLYEDSQSLENIHSQVLIKEQKNKENCEQASSSNISTIVYKTRSLNNSDIKANNYDTERIDLEMDTISNKLFSRGQIDVIEMLTEETCTYKYFLVYEDEFSKYVVLNTLDTNTAKEVAVKLLDIFAIIGAPQVLQSGNGRDFAEQVVRKLRVLWEDFVIFHGSVVKDKGTNRNFKTLLKSWITKNPTKTWYEGLKFIQICENSTYRCPNGKVPCDILFGRHIHKEFQKLIISKEIPNSMWTEEEWLNYVSNKRKSSMSSMKQIKSPNETIFEPVNDENQNDDHKEDYVNLQNDYKDTEDESLHCDNNTSNFKFVNVKSETPLDNIQMEESGLEDLEKSKDSRVSTASQYLKCTICQKRYMKLGHLKNHIKTHMKKWQFECTLCNKAFHVLKMYENHMQQFHGHEKQFSAIDSIHTDSIEHNKLTSEHVMTDLLSINEAKAEETLKMHGPITRTMQNNRTLLCTTNKRSKYTKRSSLIKRRQLAQKKAERRVSKINEDPMLECSYCKQKFNFPSMLKRHMRSHTNERPYICKICNKSFKQLGHLSQHSLTHKDYRSFQCAVCGIRFESLHLLKAHSHSHQGEPILRSKEIYRLFECDNCKKVFTTKSRLERHIFTHTHERQFGCKICGKRFKQAGHVKSHMLVHTGERKFECSICSKRFSLSNSLKKHMYIHTGEKPYQCDVCGARFLEKRNLNGHLMTHTNERPFSCKICGKRYTLADTLRRHISAAHEDGRTYQCEICAKMFKQLAHLSVHKKVHNDERPFQCHLCDKNFKHKNVLKSHLAIHANIRPFECDTCKATFVRKTNLQTHIASAHMNERPYVCTICGKRFKQISHLNGHVVVHSNSMPYQCDYCDRRCNRLDNLKKHMRLHTKNKE